MSTSSGISFSGLGSGIDTASIVDALMKLERQPIDRIEADKKAVQKKSGVVTELNGLAKALRDAARDLYSPTALQGKTATSANDTIAKASAGSAAAQGTYNVTVTSLAANHTMATGAGPALNAGESLEITVGGVTKSVAIEADDTLQAFADRINGTAEVGASASVINDRLVLISRTGGAAGAITLGGSAAGGLGFATTQAGADATAVVNGLTVTGSSNTIEGAIAGVSLNLAAVGSTTITVGADTEAIQKQAQKFVDAYNALITNTNSATKYDAATKTAGTLQGDTMFTTFASSLRNTTMSQVTGLGAQYDSLAQIGITSSRTGELTLDPTKFQDALAKDPTALRRLFGADDGADTSGSADGIARRIAQLTDDFSSNAISSRQSGITANIQRMNDKIARLEDVMVLREQRLRAQFQAMENAVAQLKGQGSSLSAQFG
ncbi:MAG: flagellar filament capping protein FliD [Thermoleophilia bacterium]|nr:flagellar filament capping protein FliD [Thermoleophilia bacterium]